MVSTRNDIYAPLRPVLQGVAQGAQALGDYGLAAQASLLASEITNSNRIGYLGAALAWERGPLSLQLMGTDMSMTVFPGFEGWGAGATAAYRMGRWKPYVTWSRSLLDPKDRPLDLDRPIPPELPPPLAGYPEAVGNLRGLYPTITGYTRHDQTTIGAGVRYDVVENVALKLQVDRIDAKRSSTLLDDRGYVTGPRALTVFSATLDFVF